MPTVPASWTAPCREPCDEARRWPPSPRGKKPCAAFECAGRARRARSDPPARSTRLPRWYRNRPPSCTFFVAHAYDRAAAGFRPFPQHGLALFGTVGKRHRTAIGRQQSRYLTAMTGYRHRVSGPDLGKKVGQVATDIADTDAAHGGTSCMYTENVHTGLPRSNGGRDRSSLGNSARVREGSPSMIPA